MPDLGQWLMLAVIGLAIAAAIAWPLLRAGMAASPTEGAAEAEAEARALRHRVALDALLDVEADRRAGSLDDASYARERAEAEARAAQTLVEAGRAEPPAAGASPRPLTSRVAATWLGVALAAALVVGFALPAPVGLAERTLVNRVLADELAREADRQAEIQRLLGLLEADPQDAQVLSDLADAYLAGSALEDLQRAAVALQVLLAVEPQDRSAYRRLITAYISARDWADAQAATDSYAGLAGPDEPDIPFFRGLIAFRSGDAITAMRQFDAFLALAPEDDRVPMVTSLRAEAAGELDGAGASPGS
jgi:cytochrome c-type biogenesis protein CcmH